MRKVFPILLVLLFLIFTPRLASADNTLNIYYSGPEGNVSGAIGLDKDIHRVDDIATAQVFVLNGVIPEPESIHARVQQGAGLVLILGPDISVTQLNTLLSERVTLEAKNEPLSLNIPTKSTDSILEDILWSSSPQIRQRFLLSESKFTPLVSGYEDGSLILGKKSLGSGEIYLFTASLNSDNLQFQEWAYFNYLLYHLVESSVQRSSLSFAQYPATPVPHATDRLVLYLILVGLLLMLTWRC